VIRIAISAVIVFAATASTASAEGARLTRIEPHGVYGATVTVENGVRVTRPLPSTSDMIINPGNATPLNLRIDRFSNSDDRHGHHGHR
jgi:hypothetical protein